MIQFELVKHATQYCVIQQLAYQIWPLTFADILSQEQIAYMLDNMYSMEALKEQIESKGHIFLLVKEEEDVLGFVSYELHYQASSTTKIHKLYLLPTAQGKGAGKRSIEKVGEIACQQSDDRLNLNVNRYNQAIQFYEKVGFVKVKEENISIGNGFWMEDFVMEKPLVL